MPVCHTLKCAALLDASKANADRKGAGANARRSAKTYGLATSGEYQIIVDIDNPRDRSRYIPGAVFRFLRVHEPAQLNNAIHRRDVDLGPLDDLVFVEIGLDLSCDLRI